MAIESRRTHKLLARFGTQADIVPNDTFEMSGECDNNKTNSTNFTATASIDEDKPVILTAAAAETTTTWSNKQPYVTTAKNRMWS